MHTVWSIYCKRRSRGELLASWATVKLGYSNCLIFQWSIATRLYSLFTYFFLRTWMVVSKACDDSESDTRLNITRFINLHYTGHRSVYAPWKTNSPNYLLWGTLVSSIAGVMVSRLLVWEYMRPVGISFIMTKAPDEDVYVHWYIAWYPFIFVNIFSLNQLL